MSTKYPKAHTGLGTLLWPHFVTPDTKFDDDGVYVAKLALPEDAKQTKVFIAECNRALEAFIEENPKGLKPAVIKKARTHELYEEETDDEGEETGRLIFKFKMKTLAGGKGKTWEQAPMLFDAKLRPLTGDDRPFRMWTGTEVIINAELFPYYNATTKEFGVSLRPLGVQILKLIESEGGETGKSMGFEAEDDAYDSQPEASEQGFTAGGEGTSDDEEF